MLIEAHNISCLELRKRCCCPYCNCACSPYHQQILGIIILGNRPALWDFHGLPITCSVMSIWITDSGSHHPAYIGVIDITWISHSWNIVPIIRLGYPNVKHIWRTKRPLGVLDDKAHRTFFQLATNVPDDLVQFLSSLLFRQARDEKVHITAAITALGADDMADIWKKCVISMGNSRCLVTVCIYGIWTQPFSQLLSIPILVLGWDSEQAVQGRASCQHHVVPVQAFEATWVDKDDLSGQDQNSLGEYFDPGKLEEWRG